MENKILLAVLALIFLASSISVIPAVKAGNEIGS
jgi:hypothetical protein